MQHFPIFLDLADRTVIVAGDGALALAKLRLLERTTARLTLFAASPSEELADWARDAQVTLHRRPATQDDIAGAALVYAAHGEAEQDARLRAFAVRAGVLVNVVDNLEASDFITPAIVDRDPVTVAIGTEGAAPVLARAIKTAASSGPSIISRPARRSWPRLARNYWITRWRIFWPGTWPPRLGPGASIWSARALATRTC